MTRALITGATGQDGWYLAARLLDRGQTVVGMVNDTDVHPLPPGVTRVAGDMLDAASIAEALELAQPDVVYNLAAVSSVAASWQDPVTVAEVTGVGLARLLVAVRARDGAGSPSTRVVHASSAEIFGDAPPPQDESTPIAPDNPYGAAKAFAQHLLRQFRAQGVHVCSAILFPHESPRRPDHFVSRKITKTVAAIAAGTEQELVLGNLEARRDWGYADDVAHALELIADHDAAEDFVVATGESHSIRDFVEAAFARVGIADWQRLVVSDAHFLRPNDAADLRGDATKLRTTLGWAPSLGFEEMVALMVDHDVEELRAATT